MMAQAPCGERPGREFARNRRFRFLEAVLVDNPAAIEMATPLLKGRVIEIWEGARRVITLTRNVQRDAKPTQRRLRGASIQTVPLPTKDPAGRGAQRGGERMPRIMIFA